MSATSSTPATVQQLSHLSISQLNQQALQCMHKSNFEQAVFFLNECLQRVNASKEQLEADPNTDPSHLVSSKDEASTLNNLGCLAKRLSRFEEACNYLQQACEIEEACLGAASASTVLNLGTVYTSLGRTEEALTMAQECVNRSEPQTGDDFFVIAMHNLSVAQLCSEDMAVREQGLKTLENAVQCGKDLLGPAHALTETLQKKLGKERHFFRQQQKAADAAVKKNQQQPVSEKVAAERVAFQGGKVQNPFVHRPQPPPKQATQPDHRTSATRALRSLNFATPDDIPDAHRHPLYPHHLPPPQEKPKPQEPAFSRPDVLQGATFVSGPPRGQGPMKKEPVAASQMEDAMTPTATTTTTSAKQPSSSTAASSMQFPSGTESSALLVSSPSQHVSPQFSSSGTFHPKEETNEPIKTQGTEKADGKEEPHSNVVPATTTTTARKKQTSPVTGEPIFTRFAAEIASCPPPVPVSFAVIREELRIENQVSLRKTLNVQSTTVKKSGQSLFAQKVQARNQRIKKEMAEEDRLAEETKRRREAAAKEAERQRRVEEAMRRRRQFAARTIQRHWRFYRATHGARKKKQRRVEKTRDIPKACKLEIKYGRRWLRKTWARRLMLQYMNPTSRKSYSYHQIIGAITKIQHWAKQVLAKLEANRRRKLNIAFGQTIQEMDRRNHASMQIQSCWRKRMSRLRVAQVRSDTYTKQCKVIQRWIRSQFDRTKRRFNATIQAGKRSAAAGRIQAAWRGKQSRDVVVVIRLKKKIERMRQKERNAVKTMQRTGRAYLARCRVQAKRKEEKQYCTIVSAPSAAIQQAQSMQGPLRERLNKEAEDRQLRLREVERTNAIEREIYLDVVMRSVAEQNVRDHTQQHSTHAVELSRAGEQLTRSRELRKLQRERGAKLVQRLFRRWKNSMTEDRRERIKYYRAALQKEHFFKREKEFAENEKRKELRQENDLAAGIRMQKEAALQEMKEIENEMIVKDEDGESDALTVREIEEREAAAQRLKVMERQLEDTIHREKEWLRTAKVGGTIFRTVKERRSSSRND